MQRELFFLNAFFPVAVKVGRIHLVEGNCAVNIPQTFVTPSVISASTSFIPLPCPARFGDSAQALLLQVLQQVLLQALQQVLHQVLGPCL